MQKLRSLAILILAIVNSYIPKRMPQSPAALEDFVSQVLYAGGFPDNDSFRVAIYTQVLHTSADSSFLNQRKFINSVRRSVTNQLSYNLMMIHKGKEKANEQSTVQETSGQVVS